MELPPLLVFKHHFYNQIKRLPGHKPLKYSRNLLDLCQFFRMQMADECLKVSRGERSMLLWLEGRVPFPKHTWRQHSVMRHSPSLPAPPVAAIYAASCTTARLVQVADLLTRLTPMATHSQRRTRKVLRAHTHTHITEVYKSILDTIKGGFRAECSSVFVAPHR